MLDEVEEIAKSIPPVDNSASRFGNPAFKTFYDKVQEVSLSTSSHSSDLIRADIQLSCDFRYALHYTLSTSHRYQKKVGRSFASTFTSAGATGHE
jgi:hypothetical protein